MFEVQGGFIGQLIVYFNHIKAISKKPYQRNTISSFEFFEREGEKYGNIGFDKGGYK
jgi:hypothetical protein